ncbi:hypothetical protein E4N62_44270 [Streptomyces sp. MNU76]|uniref:hypothetical protein n=1 Tax=Streptomyces sp. MNU76 TaxID=2560026 RepID=UPI001E5E161E|nr:hypothetical protein [Streptomyces sp. MNU76]MCC9711619.1 hypothetical protein [Streptomyces sp. MNU76]
MHAHWGTFTKQASLKTGLRFAESAMRQQGFTIWDQSADNNYQVIGGNSSVIATVVCVPQSGNLWMTVSAYSTDSGLAERIRNDVRAHIVNAVLFDDHQ